MDEVKCAELVSKCVPYVGVISSWDIESFETKVELKKLSCFFGVTVDDNTFLDCRIVKYMSSDILMNVSVLKRDAGDNLRLYSCFNAIICDDDLVYCHHRYM